MNSAFQACKRCHWEPMQGASFARPRPWTDDDARFNFRYCRACGQISIEESDPTTASVWILHPDSEVMFRQGAAPSHVFAYVFSDDFLKNRGLTQPLFRGQLNSMLDMSGAVNVLLARISDVQSGERIQLSMDLFRDLLIEHARRLERDEPARLAVTTLEPLITIVGAEHALDGGPIARLKLRVTAFSILERFLDPVMGGSLPDQEAVRVASSIAHDQMMSNSTARLTYLAQQVDDDSLIDTYVEAGFLLDVLKRRQVGPDNAHAAAVWRLMLAVKAQYMLGSPFEFATKAYSALRSVIERHLWSLGLVDLGMRDQNGTTCAAVQNPQTGRMLLLPLFFPRIAIYATPLARRPLEVSDDYATAVAQV